MKTIGLAVIVAVVGFIFGTFLDTVAAQPRRQWVYKTCFTNDCIADTLNDLSEADAHEAKITTWRDWSYVWYRK